MDCKRLGATLAFALTLSGCVFAPGQHMRSSALARDDQPVGNDNIELIQITPKLIAMDRASRNVPFRSHSPIISLVRIALALAIVCTSQCGITQN